MEVINNRLETILNRLKESDLVATKVATDANMKAFTKTLNMASPVTEYDTAIGEFVRYMCKKNRSGFFRYIHANGLVHLVLLTDGAPIVATLGLRGVVTVHWDRQNKEFVVTVGGSNDAYDVVNGEVPELSSPKPRHRGKRGGRAERERREAREFRSPGSSPMAERKGAVGQNKRNDLRLTPLSTEQCANILNNTRVRARSYAEAAASVPRPAANAIIGYAPTVSDDAKEGEAAVKRIAEISATSDSTRGRSWADIVDEEDEHLGPST